MVTGMVASFQENPQGDVDGLRLDDGTEVRFRPEGATKLTGIVSLKDRVTIEGWINSGESEIHAATIKNLASGKSVDVDRPPPGIGQGVGGGNRQGGGRE